MKTRNTNRLMALVLSVLMILPLFTVSGFAATKETVQDFEAFAVGKTLTKADGFNDKNTTYAGWMLPYNQIMEESGNKFLRVPLLYDGTGADADVTTGGAVTNSDKSLMPGNATFTRADGYFVFEASYRPHGNVTSTAGTIEAQIADLAFSLKAADGAKDGGTAVTADKRVTNGRYLQLFQLDLKTGALNSQYGLSKTGAPGLVQDQWNQVRVAFNMENGRLYLYVNNILYGSAVVSPQYYNNGWISCTGASDFEFYEDALIAVKVNRKKTGAYAIASTADETYSNVNYVDADNIKTYAMTAQEVGPLPSPDEKSDDFELYAPGTKLTVADHGYNSGDSKTIPGYTKVLEDANGNNFLRVPFLYDGQTKTDAKGNITLDGGTTNWDKSVMPGNAKMTVDNDFMIIDASYRPHGNVGTVELQIRKFEFDLTVAEGSTNAGAAVTADTHILNGQYLNLCHINLGTGAITNNAYGLTTTGAPGMIMDEWNSFRYVFNLRDGSACIFVNGKLYGTVERMKPQYNDGSWKTCTNPTNFTIPANMAIVAKINKINAAYKVDTAVAADYSDANYIDIDNLKIYSKDASEFVNIPSVGPNGEVLMYVQLGDQRVGNKNLYVTKDTEYTLHYYDPSAYEGLISTEQSTSMRLSAPGGLRFATKILDKQAFDELFALVGNGLKSVKFGTLIVPEDYLTDGVVLTKESLTAAGKNYLDVEATYDKYYEYDKDAATTHFVGSIVNILQKNVARNFAATGYLEVTLASGMVYNYYSDVTYAASVKGTANKVLENSNTSSWSTSSQKILDAYANEKSLVDMMRQDLNDLNVLALGDSLFSGNDTTLGLDGSLLYDRTSQWVNLMGQKNNWNLTNLGIGGMTVSYQEDVNYLTTGKKASMYHWLMNGINEYHWNVQSSSLLLDAANTNKYLYYTNDAGTACKYNTYFQTGNFEGKTNADVDLIILEGGCNDYGTEIAAPLGTVGSTDPSTFIGAYNAVAQKLMEMYPNAKIVFITTWRLNPQTRPDNITSIEYSESVIDLYNQYYKDNDRVYLIDAGNPKVSNIHMLDAGFRAEYCISAGDKYHLNNEGMKIMESHMLPYLWQFWVDSVDNK